LTKLPGMGTVGPFLRGVSSFVIVYELAELLGVFDHSAAEAQMRQLLAENYERCMQQVAAGEHPQLFQGKCDADHDGGGPWTGSLRMDQAEATDDINAHVYDWPDHQVEEGDATVSPV